MKELITRLNEMENILRLIAEGYFFDCWDDRWIQIVNPDHDPTNGSNPYIVFDLWDGDEDELG